MFPITCLSTGEYTAECVHLGTGTSRVNEAEAAEVKSVPVRVMNGAAVHMNIVAGIGALK